jgi:hypothetical protein
MSTDFATIKKVKAEELFDGRLVAFGAREHIKLDETTEQKRCLTDGHNYMWVHINGQGLVGCVTRHFSGGAPGKILNAIAEAFDTVIVSEHEPQFWGFDTQEEWDEKEREIAEQIAEENQKFHVELLKYLRGEPNDLRPGTEGMVLAEIAKGLVEKDAALLLPANKEKLRNEIRVIYDVEYLGMPF